MLTSTNPETVARKSAQEAEIDHLLAEEFMCDPAFARAFVASCGLSCPGFQVTEVIAEPSFGGSGFGDLLVKGIAEGLKVTLLMEIFCFDLTIASLARRRGEGPGFILHDSHLFEPVDGRQFARALEIAAEFSNETGIQYIAFLNSDELARAERESEASFSKYVLKTQLSDTPEGGLFGIRFD